MDTTKIEKLTGVMSETIQELEQLMGTAPHDRDSTAELIINLTNSFILSNLERAETTYPGLAVKLLAIIHEMTKPDSALAQRIQWIHKCQ